MSGTRTSVARTGPSTVSISPTMRAFDWETARIEADDHPEEPRWIGHGMIGSRLHVVVFTERGDRIRIISLRKANPREEQRHARQRQP